MSKASWNTVDPASGSGDAVVNIGGTVHTGRTQRVSTPTFKAVGVADQTITVTQKAKAEFVNINNVSVGKEGGNVTITGKSNSQKLTFSLGAGDITVALPAQYNAGGAETNNDTVIAGDPGASAEYDFSLTLTVPKNTTINPKTRAINVVASGGQSASATISQPAGDPVLTLSQTAVTIEADGTGVAITVTSNTNWTAS